MSTKRRGLGRGLDALLGAIEPIKAPAAEKDGELRRLPVDLLRRGRYQPRVDMHPERLEELAESIRAQGVVQPIVVRPIGTEGYEIIAGERRWRAAQMAGLHEIPAVVREVPDQAAMAMALIENIQREDLNPMEEALALSRLVEEFQLTHQDAATAVGRSRVAVTNLLRLLDLNEDVKRLLERGDIEMGHARALLALKGPQQTEVARRVAAEGLSVRDTERLVQRLASANPKAKPAPAVSADVRHLQDELSERLGAAVQILHRKGKGKLVISYTSLDELDGILARIK